MLFNLHLAALLERPHQVQIGCGNRRARRRMVDVFVDGCLNPERILAAEAVQV